MLLDANDAYTRLYGYNREELLSGMTIHDITADRQVSDAATAQAKLGVRFLSPFATIGKRMGPYSPLKL